MRFCLTFKTPDVIDQIDKEDYSEDEWEQIQDMVSRHVEYGEYVVVEFDTEKDTKMVL